jgi:hypothetical protein
MDAASSPSVSDRPSVRADGSWMAWTAAGIAGIWVAVTVVSLGAPDMVTGSEQERLPVAALSTWHRAFCAGKRSSEQSPARAHPAGSRGTKRRTALPKTSIEELP